MNPFLKQAIELALANVREGGQPFGAVLVRNDEVVATGVNLHHRVHDVSAHAELVAIREGQAKLRTADLSDCVLYASGEPCPMCLSAAYFANIKAIYYAYGVEEAAAAGLTTSQRIYQALRQEREARPLPVRALPVDGELANPLQQWRERTT